MPYSDIMSYINALLVQLNVSFPFAFVSIRLICGCQITDPTLKNCIDLGPLALPRPHDTPVQTKIVPLGYFVFCEPED